MLLFQSESGKLITWGSTDDLGQSYVTSGKHGVLLELHWVLIYYYLLVLFVKVTQMFLLVKETPEPFPLPTEVSIVKAAAGWAHCVAVTGNFD
jgi:hypothetical protein